MSKKSTGRKSPVKIIRSGAVLASIYRGSTPDGIPYLYFELDREATAQNGKKTANRKFIPHHAEQIQSAAMAASEWMRQHPEAADGPVRENAAPRIQQAA